MLLSKQLKVMREMLGKNKLVPVAVIEDAELAAPLCQALVAGGVNIIEVTFRTKAAMEAIRNIRSSVPEMIVGAGTVIDDKIVPELVDNGVSFAVSPGLNPRVVDACRKSDLSIFPGVVTPSEIEQAFNLNLDTLKFFSS